MVPLSLAVLPFLPQGAGLSCWLPAESPSSARLFLLSFLPFLAELLLVVVVVLTLVLLLMPLLAGLGASSSETSPAAADRGPLGSLPPGSAVSPGPAELCS